MVASGFSLRSDSREYRERWIAGERRWDVSSTIGSPRTPAAPSGPRKRKLGLIPNQHGAWAFLILPLILGLFVSGVSWIGIAFALAWVASYPLSFYTMRVTRVVIRRRKLSRSAKRDLRSAQIWAIPVIVLGAAILAMRPWMAVIAAVAVLLWGLSLWLALRGQERGMTNDLLLVAQAVVAVPLLWALTNNDVAIATFPTVVWTLTILCAVYFTGTVLHVKSLIRKAGDRRWHWFNVGYHLLALVVMTLASPWFLVPFLACFTRSILLRPGLKPGVIGAVELVMSLLVVLAGAGVVFWSH